MKVSAPLNEIRARFRAEGTDISTEDIDRCLRCFEDIIIDKLVKGEVVKIREVGKITPSVHYLRSNLKGKQGDYETIKFKFTPFSRIKSGARELLDKAKKKSEGLL